MKYVQLLFLEVLLACCFCNCSQEPEKPLIPGVPKIIINCLLSANYDKHYPNPKHEDVKDITVLFWSPTDNLGMQTGWNSVVSRKNRNVVKWVFQSEKPVFVTTAFQRSGFIISPGDSVQIDVSENGITYSGKGAQSLQLQHKLELTQNKFVKPIPYSFKINSLDDYLKWNDYSNKRLTAAMAIMDTCAGRISEPVLKIIKANTIYDVEFSRVEAFKALSTYRNVHKDSTLRISDMTAICDSTLNNSWAKWLRECDDCSVPTWYFYQYNRIQAWKKSNFNLADDSSMNTDNKRKLVYYNTIKDNYKGLLRERLLQYIVANEAVKHMGLKNPLTDTILNDYYRQPGFPEYKHWMRKYVDSIRQRQKIAQKFN